MRIVIATTCSPGTFVNAVVAPIGEFLYIDTESIGTKVDLTMIGIKMYGGGVTMKVGLTSKSTVSFTDMHTWGGRTQNYLVGMDT